MIDGQINFPFNSIQSKSKTRGSRGILLLLSIEMRTQFQVIRNLRVPSPRPDVVARLLSVFIRRRSLRPCPYGGATRMVGEGRRGSRRAKQREWDLARARREGWRNCQCYIGSLHVRTSLCTGITSANRLSSGHLQLPQPGESFFLPFFFSLFLSFSLSLFRSKD